MATTRRIGRNILRAPVIRLLPIKKVVKSLLQAPIIRLITACYHSYYFKRAMKRVSVDPWCIVKESNVMDDLITGWGNRDWSAWDEYLSACVEYTTISDGPILECGSGLTTIVAGLIAQRKGTTVWSLEHMQEWGERVRQCLEKYQIESVNVFISPLKDYGDFHWYDPPLDLMPEKFSLVLCDGPLGATPGGRYGLLPLMRERLAPGCVILLDDAVREKEKIAVSDWKKEFNISYSSSGSRKPYFIIETPGGDK